jgi:hypothetical protein
VALVEDTEFARGFHAHFDLPDAAQGDFNHRLLQTSGGKLLGGIRFFGGDVKRPFVEVIAHTFGGDMAGLMDAVHSEWVGFAPLHLRLLLAPDEARDLMRSDLGFEKDLSVHVARHDQMRSDMGRISLRQFEDVEQAVALMLERYRDVAAADPALGENLGPTPQERLRGLHAEGHLRALYQEDSLVGLLAIAPGDVAWLKGPVVMEEVVSTQATGQGYGAAAQVAWAAGGFGDDLMIGTIDHLNHASRRTAERAGRPAVLHYGFLPLG